MENTNYKINKDRIFTRVLELAEIGKIGEKGTHRFALTEEDKEALILVTSWMEEASMEVYFDNFGNLIGKKVGENPNLPVIMIGSHVDTVPNGGRFDGTIGVIGGIEVVQAIKEADIHHEHTIEVVAFSDEEGSRFGDGLFGSRGAAGQVTLEDLLMKDTFGLTRYDSLKNFGFDINPDEINKSVRNKEDIKAYLEMHIEQGPYLEEYDKPVGIVNAITGIAGFKIRVTGESGHAGTVPMALRHDPMAGIAEIIKEIEIICKEDPTGTLVGTVGLIQAYPGGRNVIPKTVEISLDLRDIYLEKLNKAIQKITEMIEEKCQTRGLTYTLETLQKIEPVQCSDQIIQKLSESSSELNLNAPVMVSGAAHDAMSLGKIAPMGMIFIRCFKGISHDPEEFASKDDIAKGTELLMKTIIKLI